MIGEFVIGQAIPQRIALGIREPNGVFVGELVRINLRRRHAIDKHCHRPIARLPLAFLLAEEIQAFRVAIHTGFESAIRSPIHRPGPERTLALLIPLTLPASDQSIVYRATRPPWCLSSGINLELCVVVVHGRSTACG